MRTFLPIFLLLSCGGLWLWACGAENAVAPRAEQPAALDSCRGEEGLAPRFREAIAKGRTEGLRQVMSEMLTAGSRGDDPSPLHSVMRALFVTVSRLARSPAEANAPVGQVCATPAPPLQDAHPLCEMRRAGRLLVHEGKGNEWLALLDPMISGILNYIIGKEPSSSVPHYELARVIHGMCGQNATCQVSDTLDMVVALLAFAETQEGADALTHLSKLIQNPALQPFLTDDGEQYGGEAGFVALLKILFTTIQSMESPDELDVFPVDQLPVGLRADVKKGLDYIKAMLDTNRTPNVLAPTKKVLYCHQTQDANMDLLRMFYRLALDRKLDAFGLRELAQTLDTLRQADSRGSLLFLVRQIVEGLAQDEGAVDGAAQLCRTFMSTTPGARGAPSNAERVLPVVSELFSGGLANELICAFDVLIFGCTGGPSPACSRASTP